MKYKLIIEAEFDHELKPFIDAEKNQMLLEGLHGAIFRPVIKYGQDEKEIEIYENVWAKVQDYLNGV